MSERQITLDHSSVNNYSTKILANYSKDKKNIYNASTRSFITCSDAKEKLKEIAKESLKKYGKFFLGVENLRPSDKRVLKYLVLNNHEEMTYSANTIGINLELGRSTVQESITRLSKDGYITSVNVQGFFSIKTLNYDKFDDMYFGGTTPDSGHPHARGRTRSIKDININRSIKTDPFTKKQSEEMEEEEVIPKPKDRGKKLTKYEYIQWTKELTAYQNSKNAPLWVKERLKLITPYLTSEIAKKHGFKHYHLAEIVNLNEHRYETDTVIQEIEKFFKNLEDGLLPDIGKPPAYLVSIFRKYKTYKTIERREEEKEKRKKKKEAEKLKKEVKADKVDDKSREKEEISKHEHMELNETSYFKDLRKEIRENEELISRDAKAKEIERQRNLKINCGVKNFLDDNVPIFMDGFVLSEDKDDYLFRTDGISDNRKKPRFFIPGLIN